MMKWFFDNQPINIIRIVWIPKWKPEYGVKINYGANRKSIR